MTAESEEGSCPVLYASASGLGGWRRLGKIIHEAHGEALRANQAIQLDGLVTHFKIAEEELELAYLDFVHLTLMMKDGRSIEISADNPALHSVDSSYAHLFAGDSVELKFDLPEGVAPEEVMHSVLRVEGYYERYAKMILSGNLRRYQSHRP